MIVTIEASDRDSHYVDTERKPMKMGIPTLCGGFELTPEQIAAGTADRATCLWCRHRAAASGPGQGVLVPYGKKPIEPQ